MWEEEKPDWFSAKWIGKVPIELLPLKYAKSFGDTKTMRRKSINQKIKDEEREKERKRSIVSAVLPLEDEEKRGEERLRSPSPNTLAHSTN